MSNKIELVICLGSSCFARGNKNTLKLIKKYLQDNHLEDKVHFHGGHCFEKCAEGPVIMINNKIFTGVTELTIIEILNSELSIVRY